MVAATTRRQRARAASNTGEQALLVLRKNGWMTSPDDARSEAVCRAAALADNTYGLVCTGGVEHDRKIDELSAVALLAILKTGAVAASPELGAAIVVPILDKLRASFVDPTPGPALYDIRCGCLEILETLAPHQPRAIIEAGGLDVAIDLLKQLKLPGSTAVRRLTEMSARNICVFLEPLINAEPAYADAVRLGLKEFTNHPEFFTFMEYANRGTLHWLALQLANAPGGPPGFLLD